MLWRWRLDCRSPQVQQLFYEHRPDTYSDTCDVQIVVGGVLRWGGAAEPEVTKICHGCTMDGGDRCMPAHLLSTLMRRCANA
eukprot:366391-Chlamydomonas_euryale.AAC.41